MFLKLLTYIKVLFENSFLVIFWKYENYCLRMFIMYKIINFVYETMILKYINVFLVTHTLT